MRNTYTILSVLMIIGGIASIIIYVCAIAFSSFLASFGGNGVLLILYPVMAMLAGVAELVAGILGARDLAKKKGTPAAMICGLITVALNVAVLLMAMGPLNTNVAWYSWVLSLIVPVLFLLFAVINGIVNREKAMG